ncbi:peptidylprolyl isomerase [Flavobacteriaceae bacterium 14752]|uniref:peptidylprolyl isomerase n=1 Tax=Mesohalobacter salilacus TaxID=2491711 RepID=UPI000F62FC8D|nr:hypothetical protein EIG84_10305 [Flavobacteriaceae bacterium 14752]
MRLIYFSFILCIFSKSSNAQRGLFNQPYETILNDFNLSESELESYKSQGKIIIFNEVKHKTRLAKSFLNYRKGKSKIYDKGFYEVEYKVIAKEKIPHFRVRYIYIDQSKFETEKNLNDYLQKVRSLLEETAFKSVAMQYSMDYHKNMGGDSGWFKQGKTLPDFFDKATSTNRLSEEIFEFEIPELNAYYFVKKTHSKKDIKEVVVLETKIKK